MFNHPNPNEEEYHMLRQAIYSMALSAMVVGLIACASMQTKTVP
jgi:hypothetical protein